MKKVAIVFSMFVAIVMLSGPAVGAQFGQGSAQAISCDGCGAGAECKCTQDCGCKKDGTECTCTSESCKCGEGCKECKCGKDDGACKCSEDCKCGKDCKCAEEGKCSEGCKCKGECGCGK